MGTASLYRPPEDGQAAFVLTVFVDIAHHGQGIGRRLMGETEACARRLGVRELRIPASIYGYDFYRRLGYADLTGKKEPDGQQNYWMVKRLGG